MGKRLTEEEAFIKLSSSQTENNFDYSRIKYINSTTKVEIICSVHGSFWQRPVDHWNGRGCNKCGKKTYDWESFKEKANKKHNHKYTYPKQKWIETRQTINITCPTHGNFTKTASIHLIGQGCPKCSQEAKKLKWKDVIQKCNEIHNNKYDYSKVLYKGKQGKIEIICPLHGSFWQRAEDHSRGHGCSKCGFERNGIANTKSFEEFMIDAFRVHGNRYTYNKQAFVNYTTPTPITCSIHGVFIQEPRGHIGGYGCRKCGNIEHGLNRRISFDAFLIRVNKRHDNKYTYIEDSYEKMSSKVKIICPKHGIFEQKGSMHAKGDGCPICNESKGEREIRKILKHLKVQFKSQKTFTMCRNIHVLPFDFYLPEFDMLLEYNGEFHYGVIQGLQTEEEYQHRIYLDKIKKEYAEANHKFLVIPYWDFDNIEEILEKEINKLK